MQIRHSAQLLTAAKAVVEADEQAEHVWLPTELATALAKLKEAVEDCELER